MKSSFSRLKQKDNPLIIENDLLSAQLKKAQLTNQINIENQKEKSQEINYQIQQLKEKDEVLKMQINTLEKQNHKMSCENIISQAPYFDDSHLTLLDCNMQSYKQSKINKISHMFQIQTNESLNNSFTKIKRINEEEKCQDDITNSLSDSSQHEYNQIKKFAKEQFETRNEQSTKNLHDTQSEMKLTNASSQITDDIYAKYKQLKLNYSKALKIIDELQSKIKFHENDRNEETHSKITSNSDPSNIITMREEAIESDEKNDPKTPKKSSSEKIIAVLKKKLLRSKEVYENQKKHIVELNEKVSQLTQELNKSKTQSYKIPKKMHLRVKGSINGQANTIFSIKNNNSLVQYQVLCNILNVECNEFDKKWTQVFNRINQLKTRKERSNQKDQVQAVTKSNSKLYDFEPFCNNRNDLTQPHEKLEEKYRVLQLSSRFGVMISNFYNDLYKQVEDLHVSLSFQSNSGIRKIILIVIFLKRLSNISCKLTTFSDRALTVFAEQPQYSHDVLIRNIRNKFTTLTNDLVYATYNLNESKETLSPHKKDHLYI
ncbi:hypothetical protein TRFO_17690 [Tritrichomonas foetus]|uniref:Uncharacterized protein n=1 Tax=Tritrichomonas foetus TaxID=1144522 RepID=A0A1J4KRI8_9EUKA|nr:hypothetical protein TRFO_17690 [Tritrichomonas foetus]|eukprot:OHT12428.1 hypothetical protein TRFO_17690 [Tritrichomonas foetus]